ncbi:hypothetical protein Vadar_001700 [Vaccinium darrowii]|uniref:Uncharacterized protein n=1 Tax=Vaccinium darrowii TaxID=229202 RepID=A0ACB7ZIV9_9ERIC|nr:hypothetical protein Vadar_001700 [Vaccinium darrowii]
MMFASEGPRHIVAWMHEVAASLWGKVVRNLTKALSWGIVTNLAKAWIRTGSYRQLHSAHVAGKHGQVFQAELMGSYFQQARPSLDVLADYGQASITLELQVRSMANAVMDALQERVTQLEKLVGAEESDEEVTLTEAKFVEMMVDVTKLSDGMKERVSNIELDLLVVKRAFLGCSDGLYNRVNMKVPEPKAFGGARNAKELEDLLWDMEQYFSTARVPEGERVTITVMYRTGDAKLWWRTRSEDEVPPKIETWESLKKELKEQLGLKDLPSAIAAADGLTDFKLTNKSNSSESSSAKSKDKNKKKDEKKAGSKKWDKGQKSKSVEDDKWQDKGNFSKGCFICKGPHRARDCPKRKKLNAIFLDEGNNGDPDSDSHICVNPLQLLNVIHADKASPSQRSGLMYVKVMLCNTDVLAMVDTGATHNFFSEGLAQSLGLKNGRVDLMVYPLDDFELILGNEFFLAAKVAVMPYLGGILIADEKQPCFVLRHAKDKRIREGTGSWISVIQVQKGPKKGEATYLAALVEIKPDVQVEVPDGVAGLLKEFADVMPPELPKYLPPRRATDHKIELLPGRHNQVTDALSHKEVQKYVAAITRVESDFADRIRENAKTDAEYQRLVKQVEEGTVRRYWLENSLFHAKGDRLTSATGLSPFELATGQQPLTPHEVARTRTGGRCPAACRFSREKQELLEEAKDSLSKVAKRMKKLKVHPTFHVSFLKPYHEDLVNLGRKQAKRAPPVIQKQFDRGVERILDHKTEGQSKKNKRTSYLVKWENSPDREASLEKAETLWQFEKQVEEYLQTLPTRTSASSSGGPRHIVAWMHEVAASLRGKVVRNLTKALSWGIVTNLAKAWIRTGSYRQLHSAHVAGKHGQVFQAELTGSYFQQARPSSSLMCW